MSEATMEFLPRVGEKFSTISGFAEALGGYARATFPTRKDCAREWRLRDDEARATMEGRASKATVERIFHKSRGGWSVSLAVVSAVVGERLDEHLTREGKRHEENAARLGALAADLRARPGASDPPSVRVDTRKGQRRNPLDS